MALFTRLFKKDKNRDIDKDNLPGHIAIIMDGNGRWARRRGMPRSAGHKEGANTLRKIVTSCYNVGIKYLTVYAFSTENWTRPKSEVDSLMNLLFEYLKNADKEIGGKNIRIRVVGNVNGLPEKVRNEIARVTHKTQKNSGLNLIFALNYGGRDEITNAVKKIARDANNGKLKIDEINEQLVSSYMYTEGIPDPDLLIRPSGERRISNFLLWQCAYTEFWYSNILWPDFREDDLLKAIQDYQKRNRRYGGI